MRLKRTRRTGKKIIVLFLVFLITVVGIIFLTTGDRTVIVSYKKMEQAAFPVVYTEYAGMTVNTMHGYRQPMQMQYMRETVVPLPEDRNLTVFIDTYGQEIIDISYEIRSLDTTRLVENTTLKEWDEQAGRVTAKLPIQNLLAENQEYALKLVVTTRDTGMIYYYTRIINNQKLPVDKMIEFAQDIHEQTIDPARKKNMAAYVKTNTQPRDTFGMVTLNSTYAQITWGKMKPVQRGGMNIFIKDLTESIATFDLAYQVDIPDENGRVDTYRAVETYVIQKSGSSLRMLSFQRTLDQIFSPESVRIEDGRLPLGILSQDELSYYASSNGVYRAFSVNEELWSYDNDKEKLSCIFSFTQDGDDGVRTDFNEHDIQIVNIDDKGNINFIVYGYMNRGNHEGQCGLVFYEYQRKEGVVEEIFYLPSETPYEILKEEMGKLSYLSDSGLFYLMLEGSVYAIDFAGNEFVTIVENTTEDKLAISEDSSVIAWQEGDDIYGAERIQVMNLSDGSNYTVTANEGEVIRALDFISNDFICGIAKKADITSENGMVTKFPMYAVEILNKEGVAETRYEKPGIYISGIEVVPGSIKLLREQKSGGEYVETHEDALIQNAVPAWKPESAADKVNLELRKNIYMIPVTDKKVSATVGVAYVSKLLEENSISLAIASGETADLNYYAYAGGKLLGICTTVQEAAALSYDRMGMVMDGNGHYILRRGYLQTRDDVDVPIAGTAQNGGNAMAACLEVILKKENAMTDVKKRLEEGENSLQILTEQLSGRVVDLSGCSLKQVMYHYLNMGSPILALWNQSPVLITGYSSSDVKIFHPVTSSFETIKLTEAEDNFARSGNWFISYLQTK